MISIVSPIYNEENNIKELCERIEATMKLVNEEFEIILVENGSSDNSLNLIKELRKKDNRIKYLSLSRNFGHQGAIIAGLSYASGDAVITIDGDLEHPPEVMIKMIDSWKSGYDVVFTKKNEKSVHKYFYFKKIFYKLISHMSELEFSYGQSDYRLLDHKVVSVLLNIPEKNKFLRGMVKWVGFAQIGIDYDVDMRKSGESKFSFWNYLNFALDGIFSFSVFPLKVFLFFGLGIAAICGFYAVYFAIMGIVTLYFKKDLLPPGWATITFSITFLGSVQLIGIGCLGEYIARIYAQTKERPDFIVKEEAF